MTTFDERSFLKRISLDCADDVVKEEGVDLLFGAK